MQLIKRNDKDFQKKLEPLKQRLATLTARQRILGRVAESDASVSFLCNSTMLH